MRERLWDDAALGALLDAVVSHSRCRVDSDSRHATEWPACDAGSSMGSTSVCAGRTYGQRGWKLQPVGGVMRLGGRPAIGTSSSSRGADSRGIEASRPQV